MANAAGGTCATRKFAVAYGRIREATAPRVGLEVNAAARFDQKTLAAPLRWHYLRKRQVRNVTVLDDEQKPNRAVLEGMPSPNQRHPRRSEPAPPPKNAICSPPATACTIPANTLPIAARVPVTKYCQKFIGKTSAKVLFLHAVSEQYPTNY